MCKDCSLSVHKQPEHATENIEETGEGQREFLEKLVKESRHKIEVCNEASTTLMNSLSDIQMQRDNVKGLIQETFQSYKAILEKKRVRIYY